MGLQWSKMRIVKNNTLLLLTANIPESTEIGYTKDDYWNLYRDNKDELKTFGFGVSKDAKTKLWNITYFQDVSGETFTKTEVGMPLWEYQFNQKISKWEKKLQAMQEAKLQKVEVDEEDD